MIIQYVYNRDAVRCGDASTHTYKRNEPNCPRQAPKRITV